MLDMSDFVPTCDLSRAQTMPSRWYLDPAFWPLERDRIFARSWQLVGHAGQFEKPGDYVATAIAEDPIVVIRGDDGVLRAMSNVCRHRAYQILQGRGSCNKAMQCKYHGFTYSLDGKLRGTPDFDGVNDWCKDDFTLPQLRVDTWGPLVFACIDPAAPPLSAWLGDIPARTDAAGVPFQQMKFVHQGEYDVEANWKVYIDNYQEGYHVPTAHPGLMTELDYHKYQIEPLPFGTLQHAPLRKNTGKERRYAPGTAAMDQALYFWMCPNFMINLYPDNMDTNLVIPTGPDSCKVIITWYATDPDAFRPTFEAQGLAFSEQVQEEDRQICRAVQAGLRSRFYDRGRFSVKQEAAVHHFHRLVHALLQGAPLGVEGPLGAESAAAPAMT